MKDIHLATISRDKWSLRYKYEDETHSFGNY